MNFHDDEEIISIFQAETSDHLSTIEYNILKLESSEDYFDDELVHCLFRAAHSIKSGANLLGFQNIEDLSHCLENLLQKIRSNKLKLNGEIVNTFLEGIDKIGEMNNNLQKSNSFDIGSLKQKLSGLDN